MTIKTSIQFLIIALLIHITGVSARNVEFSTAGFFQIENTGRTVVSFNPGWKFYKGEINNPVAINYDDSSWETVNLPHGIENLPAEASGSINYQGVVWYRKKFDGHTLQKGKRHFLYFEAIMGKSNIYLNGKLIKKQFGGYLPAIVDITDEILYDGTNIIAVMADNSNDPLVPPGKRQEVLDFTYAGGIYRDCWLISNNNVFITDANYENVIAGGGLVISCSDVSKESADVNIKFNIRNSQKKSFKGAFELILKSHGSEIVKKTKVKRIRISSNDMLEDNLTLNVSKPQLWSPERPNLYDLYVYIKDNKGRIVDGYRKRIGIRSIEFKGEDGLYLNGKPYRQKLIGANRHQDFAIVGNALSNSLHWRDAKKLRDAGMTLIRNAHYPQDPAFMDACDELGLFVIVNTPGWQWWTNNPIFEKRVYSDIRNMIRRDRNHACLFLWEPILNETRYPDTFAKNAFNIVSEEFVNGEKYSVCDESVKSSKYFPVLYAHPGHLERYQNKIDTKKTYLTREWGDNVDNWSSHNSNSRVSLSWGEIPMLIQAKHYAKPHYSDSFSCLDFIDRMPSYYIGGCLWHSFDHQRGYHPDPFYGGIMNNFRYPKISYYMFSSQRDPKLKSNLFDSGPIVHIAHEMNPFSSKDVTIYSNCDSVTLQVFGKGKKYSYVRDKNYLGIKYPIITIKDVWDFYEYKRLSRANKNNECYMEAKGYIDGVQVCSDKVRPSLRPSKIKLWVDDEGLKMKADGSDLVVVHAMVTDERGVVKRLNNQTLTFELEGEGELVVPYKNLDNSFKVEYGVSSVIVRSTVTPGEIKITAHQKYQGINTIKSGSVTINTVAPDIRLLYDPKVVSEKKRISRGTNFQNSIDLKRENIKEDLKVIEDQQDAFGEK